MGSVLVHIDLDGERPHASSLAAVVAGRAIASSWGATLYAAVIVHDPSEGASPDSTAQVISTQRVPGVGSIQNTLALAGADKIIVAVTDAALAPLWASIGIPWQGVLDHLRPRLVLFGADAPSTAELGPRSAARIGARLFQRARATGGDQVELRDRDGTYARASDGGAVVALIGAARATSVGDDVVDMMVLAVPGGIDTRIELASTSAMELTNTLGPVIALGDDVANDQEVVGLAKRLAAQLGGVVVGGPTAMRAGAIATTAVIDRNTPLSPDLCIAIGAVSLDLAGATHLVRIGPSSGKGVEGFLSGPPGASLAELTRILDER